MGKRPTKDELKELERTLENVQISEFWIKTNRLNAEINLKKARRMVKSWRGEGGS